MGCWELPFESDAGLDAISLIRKHLPEQGIIIELRQMLAWSKADSWNAPRSVRRGIQAQWQWQN